MHRNAFNLTDTGCVFKGRKNVFALKVLIDYNNSAPTPENKNIFQKRGLEWMGIKLLTLDSNYICGTWAF
jgi:hypothetical protein